MTAHRMKKRTRLLYRGGGHQNKYERRMCGWAPRCRFVGSRAEVSEHEREHRLSGEVRP